VRLRFLFILPALATAIFCNAGVSHASDKPVSCEVFTVAGSELASLLGSPAFQTTCRREDNEDGSFAESIFAAGLVEEKGGASFYLSLKLFRSDAKEWNLLMPRDGVNERYLSEKLPVRLGDVKAGARIERYERTDMDNLTFVCIRPDLPRRQGNLTSVIELCRSVKIQASDDEAWAITRETVERFVPDIKP
jgi:hypothetical protein